MNSFGRYRNKGSFQVCRDKRSVKMSFQSSYRMESRHFRETSCLKCPLLGQVHG